MTNLHTSQSNPLRPGRRTRSRLAAGAGVAGLTLAIGGLTVLGAGWAGRGPTGGPTRTTAGGRAPATTAAMAAVEVSPGSRHRPEPLAAAPSTGRFEVTHGPTTTAVTLLGAPFDAAAGSGAGRTSATVGDAAGDAGSLTDASGTDVAAEPGVATGEQPTPERSARGETAGGGTAGAGEPGGTGNTANGSAADGSAAPATTVTAMPSATGPAAPAAPAGAGAGAGNTTGAADLLAPAAAPDTAPASAAPAAVAPAAGSEEARFLALLNATRAERGVGALQEDAALRGAAQAWAEHLAATGTFEHQPLAPLLGARAAVAENLALAGSVDAAYAALLGSPGHLANLVDPRFRAVGIGVARSADGSLITCHLFGA